MWKHNNESDFVIVGFCDSGILWRSSYKIFVRTNFNQLTVMNYMFVVTVIDIERAGGIPPLQKSPWKFGGSSHPTAKTLKTSVYDYAFVVQNLSLYFEGHVTNMTNNLKYST